MALLIAQCPKDEGDQTKDEGDQTKDEGDQTFVAQDQ